MSSPLPDGWQENLLQDRERCLVAIGFLDHLLKDEEQESDQILVERSKAYLGVDDWEAALADCQQAIQIDTKNVDAYRVSARVMNKLSNPQGAIKAIDETIDGQPNPRASDLAFRSILYSETEQDENAIQDANSALKIDQSCGEAYIALALIHLKQKEYRKTTSDLRIAQDLTPSDPRVPMLMARMHLAKRDCPEAFRYADKTLEIDSGNWQAYQIKSEVHRLSHDYDAAIADTTLALGLANSVDLPALHLARASAYASQGQISHAIEDCRIALALKPDMVAATALLTTFEQEKKRQDENAHKKEELTVRSQNSAPQQDPELLNSARQQDIAPQQNLEPPQNSAPQRAEPKQTGNPLQTGTPQLKQPPENNRKPLPPKEQAQKRSQP